MEGEKDSKIFKSTDIHSTKAGKQTNYFTRVRSTLQDKLHAKATARKAARAAQAQDPAAQKRRRKVTTVILIILIIAVAGLLAYLIVSQIITQQQEQEAASSVNFPACLEENIPPESARSIADDVNVSACADYSESQDVEQYISAFIDYEQSADLGDSSKAELYFALAKNLYNYRALLKDSNIENNNYDSRIIEYAKQADLLNPTAMTAYTVLDYATAIGDDATASEYQAIYDSRNTDNKEIDQNVKVSG